MRSSCKITPRILYTLHSAIGHLGIFVSAKIAQKEHKEIGSTLKSIEALPPGLYELVITEKTSNRASPQYSVGFEERTIEPGRKDLTVIANDSARPGVGIGKLIDAQGHLKI